MKRLLENMFSLESPPDHIVVSGIQFLLTCLERRCVCVPGIYIRKCTVLQMRNRGISLCLVRGEGCCLMCQEFG